MPILLSTAVAFATTTAIGCAGQVTAQPAYAAAPPPPPAAVAVSEGPAPPPPAPPPPAPPAAALQEDVIYDVQPPMADIEGYPSVVYGGATVYYAGGVWYRRGPSGWGRYRTEPPGLARLRAAHARDARWVRQGEPRPAPPGAAEIQRPARPERREVRP